jgi:hypothetical protein
MLLDQVIERLSSLVPDLTGRVEGAAQLALLMGRNELPPVTPAAFVVPLGLDAGAQMDATSVHQQTLTETIAAVLVVDYAGDHQGGLSLPAIDKLANDVIAVMAGWRPDDAIDAFALRRGRMLDARNGTLIYQLDFSMMSFLRIT